ncbi:MAG: peptidylprolyl isomerase [Bacillales bacterium]|nr:peptidylprolyl isomerase [Bacillales bacterium]
MNKRLLTLSMVGLLSIGLTSCSDVKPAKDDKGNEIIITIGGENYTADELLADYGETASGVSAYYDAIYDVLIRDAQKSTSNIEKLVDKDIDEFVKDVKQKASSNGKTYRAQLSDDLEAKGVESLEEYREVLMLERKKTTYQDQWYEDHMESLSKEYFKEKTPYHVKHILVKTNSAGTSLYDGRISETEALKLFSVVERLASGKESFGQIAQQASDDTSSAAIYGSSGIMDQDTGFVSPFKLGVFAYDALYDNHNNNTEERMEALNIPSKVLEEKGDAALSGSNTYKSLDVKKAIETVGLVPYQALLDLKKFADKTTTVDNLVYVPQASDTEHYNPAYADRVGQTIDESYYPRNIIFNNYLNDNGLYVITNEGFDGDASKANFEVFSNICSTPILTDGNHNPILVTRGGSGDSYQGIHFIVIEQSPFWYTQAKLDNSKPFANGQTPSVEDYLLYYYSTDVPATSETDVSDDQRFVTFIKTSRTEYSKRATTIENTVKGFDVNVQYKIWEELLYSDVENHVVKDNIKIDEKILKSIENWIDSKYKTSEVSFESSNLDTWTSYVELLTLQDEVKEKKQLGLDFIKLYDSSYTKTDVKTNKD